MQTTTSSLPQSKPRLRGFIHQYAFFGSLLAGSALVAFASTAKALAAIGIFALTGSAMLGVSALYHRRNWSPRARAAMRKLDHSMIFLLIAGSYTPFGLLVIHGPLATIALGAIWLGALCGCAMEALRDDGSKWVMAIACLFLGWGLVVTFPSIAVGIGWLGAALLGVGGLAYTAGAVIYAAQKPNPVPSVFGYHEVFHVLVVIALALQYLVVAAYVLPA